MFSKVPIQLAQERNTLYLWTPGEVINGLSTQIALVRWWDTSLLAVPTSWLTDMERGRAATLAAYESQLLASRSSLDLLDDDGGGRHVEDLPEQGYNLSVEGAPASTIKRFGGWTYC